MPKEYCFQLVASNSNKVQICICKDMYLQNRFLHSALYVKSEKIPNTNFRICGYCGKARTEITPKIPDGAPIKNGSFLINSKQKKYFDLTMPHSELGSKCSVLDTRELWTVVWKWKIKTNWAVIGTRIHNRRNHLAPACNCWLHSFLFILF